MRDAQPIADDAGRRRAGRPAGRPAATTGTAASRTRWPAHRRRSRSPMRPVPRRPRSGRPRRSRRRRALLGLRGGGPVRMRLEARQPDRPTPAGLPPAGGRHPCASSHRCEAIPHRRNRPAGPRTRRGNVDRPDARPARCPTTNHATADAARVDAEQQVALVGLEDELRAPGGARPSQGPAPVLRPASQSEANTRTRPAVTIQARPGSSSGADTLPLTATASATGWRGRSLRHVPDQAGVRRRRPRAGRRGCRARRPCPGRAR